MNEKLIYQNAPHVRQSASVQTMMTDVIIALLPVYFMAAFYHGVRSIMLGLWGVFCCIVCAVLGNIVLREKPKFDLTPAITGLMIPLLLPADIPFYVITCASAIAIWVVKIPFGGTGNNLFNPAAVGFASVAICWPELIFRYPATMQAVEVFGESTVATVQGPAYSLSLGAVPNYTVLDMLLGSAPGPMGATNILVIIAAGIYLIVRKAMNWITPVSFLGAYSVLCLLFPRITAPSLEGLCYELFSGTIIFGAFFMLPEPVTTPKRDFGKLLSAVSAAVAVFLFRYFGGFEMGFASALILMNVFSPLFDELCEKILRIHRRGDSVIKILLEKKTKTAPAITEAGENEEKEEALT